MRTNPNTNVISKGITNIDKTSVKNGWQLLVTDRGLYFIEIFYTSIVADSFARLTYIGAVKSALISNTGQNMAFWNIGHNAQDPEIFFGASNASNMHYKLEAYNRLEFAAANIKSFTGSQPEPIYSNVAIELLSELYLYSASAVAAKHPGILLRYNNDSSKRYGVYDVATNGRNLIILTMSYSTTNADQYAKYARQVAIDLDNWDY